MAGTAPKTDDDALVGTTVAGRYEIKARIARGGMSYIYHAVQVGLGRDVALKVMHAEDDEAAAKELTRRLLNEAAAAAKLSHPNTIVIHDYGHLDDGRCFIAMERLEGVSLQDRIAEDGPLSPHDAVHVGLQMAGSLAEAHDAGMIHRDLKPANVMLTRRGADPCFVKVVDFGLVKKDPKDAAVDESGALVGTPRYMAPEQVVNDRVSPATDVYGLGATLYHALTGRPPFESDSRFVLMAAHVTTAPKGMREVVAGTGLEIPEALESVVMRCLRKEPEERFASMHELADALAEALGEGGPTTMRASLPGVRAVRPAATSEIDALAETVSEPATPATRPWVWGALGALALAAALAAVALAGGALDPSRAPRPEPAHPRVESVPAESSPAAPAQAEPAAPAGRATAEPVTVTVEPPSATLHRGGDDLGNSPLTLQVPAGERWEIEVRAAGYASRTITLTGAQREVRVQLERRGRRRASEPAASSPTSEGSTSRPPRSDNRDPWADSP
ncbi:MAG: serine/threonine protein kinase [Sandaracinaceae bacterium]|nr:serine/threonine protein kinase [Sandaracinaceae bacterium]